VGYYRLRDSKGLRVKCCHAANGWVGRMLSMNIAIGQKSQTRSPNRDIIDFITLLNENRELTHRDRIKWEAVLDCRTCIQKHSFCIEQISFIVTGTMHAYMITLLNIAQQLTSGFSGQPVAYFEHVHSIISCLDISKESVETSRSDVRKAYRVK
jgi:hypothetical protein